MRKIFALSIILLLPWFAYSQNSGQLTVDRFFYGKGDAYNLKTIESLTVKWNLTSLYGEPVVNGAFKWEAGSGTPIDFLDYQDYVVLESDTRIRSKMVCIKLSPTVPEAGDGFGMNASGSPSWENVFCDFDGNSLNITAEEAKGIWKSGFEITGAHLARD